MVFVLLGIEATLGDARGIWEHLLNFREVRCFQAYFKALWMGIQNLQAFPLADEHIVAVMTAGSHSRQSQIVSYG